MRQGSQGSCQTKLLKCYFVLQFSAARLRGFCRRHILSNRVFFIDLISGSHCEGAAGRSLSLLSQSCWYPWVCSAHEALVLANSVPESSGGRSVASHGHVGLRSVPMCGLSASCLPVVGLLVVLVRSRWHAMRYSRFFAGHDSLDTGRPLNSIIHSPKE